jgi:hypothetical protein
MVQAPAPGVILVCDRCLPAGQKEAARITAAHLISGQQLPVVLQQPLQNRLSLIRRNRQGHEPLTPTDEMTSSARILALQKAARRPLHCLGSQVSAQVPAPSPKTGLAPLHHLL